MIAALCIACFVLGFAANSLARAAWTQISRERTAKKTKRGGVHYPQTPPSGRVVPVKLSDPVVAPPRPVQPAPLRPAQPASASIFKPRLSFRPDASAPQESAKKRLSFLSTPEEVDAEG